MFTSKQYKETAIQLSQQLSCKGMQQCQFKDNRESVAMQKMLMKGMQNVNFRRDKKQNTTDVLQRTVEIQNGEICNIKNPKDKLLVVLRELLDSDYSKALNPDEAKEVKNNCDKYISGIDKLPDNLEQYTNFSAIISGKKDQQKLSRQSTSTVIGHWGSCEFFWRTGGVFEAFEGGHLIPHKYFDSNQADIANSPLIIVPMSRNMNVGEGGKWKDVEDEISAKCKKGGSCQLDVSINRPDWDLSEEVVEKLIYGMINIYTDFTACPMGTSAIPSNITATVNKNKYSVSENEIHDFYSSITDGSIFLSQLIHSPLYGRLSLYLKTKFWDFCMENLECPDPDPADMSPVPE